MKHKRTAGPWRIGDAGLTVFGPPNDNRAPDTVAITSNRADAHLIAAAPQLLAALSALMVTEAELRNPECTVMRDARAAIANAIQLHYSGGKI